ncbi:MAG: TIGR03617 family F420-dependent LLM class oxidoreductase [Chloroflexi bacterium]|nr:TIGR03617 family F420-dependent LLM class oxidoreductase [Chloroflexota bacterium]
MFFDVVLNADTLSQIRLCASVAEDIGFDALWAPETVHDPFMQLVLAADATKTLQMGTAVAVAFARSPMQTAYAAWDLARYSEGRFILGLGTQIKPHIERRFAMPWGHPTARLREYVQALRHIWNVWQQGGRMNFRGKFYKLTLMPPFFNPGPLPHPSIPIYLAGVNRHLCELAGELADGFHVHPFHTVPYLRNHIRPWIAAGAEKGDRSQEQIALSATVFVVVGDNESERQKQWDIVRQQICFYASTPSYRPVLEEHGWGEIGDALGRLALRQRWSEMPALVPPEMVATFAVTGTWDEIGALVYRRYQGLLDRITFYLPFIPGERDESWARALQGFRAAATRV